MRQRISISESEWQVMKVLWGEAPRTLPEILDSLRDTDWSKTTIQTYLARLVKKGALFTKRQGKGYYLRRPESAPHHPEGGGGPPGLRHHRQLRPPHHPDRRHRGGRQGGPAYPLRL